MNKKRMVMILSVILIMGMSIEVCAASAVGTIWGDVTGSVTVDFSSNYGVYAGTITAKPDGEVKLVGYKNSFSSDVKSQSFKINKRTIGFKKNVGKRCKKVLVAITKGGKRKVSAYQTRK